LANRQHYVPKFLIKRFKVKGQALYHYNFLNKNFKTKGLDVFSKYSHWSSDFESKLKSIEDKVSKILNGLINLKLPVGVGARLEHLKPDERRALYTFMLIQGILTPFESKNKEYFEQIQGVLDNEVGIRLKNKFFYLKISDKPKDNKTFILTDTPAVPEWQFKENVVNEPGVIAHYMIISPTEIIFYGGENHALDVFNYAMNNTNKFNLLNIAVTQGKCEVISSDKKYLESIVKYYLENESKLQSRWIFLR